MPAGQDSGDGGSGGGAPGRGPGPGEGPVIALRMEALLVWLIERAAKFPRDHKFTVGDRLVEAALDVTEALVEASYKRDKDALLARASRGLVRARVLMRVARSLRLVSEKQHLFFVTESDEVGRMLGGWMRARRSR